MSIKELFSRFTVKSQIEVIVSKIFDKTITEDEIAELIVNKRIFKWYKKILI